MYVCTIIDHTAGVIFISNIVFHGRGEGPPWNAPLVLFFLRKKEKRKKETEHSQRATHATAAQQHEPDREQAQSAEQSSTEQHSTQQHHIVAEQQIER